MEEVGGRREEEELYIQRIVTLFHFINYYFFNTQKKVASIF